MIRKNILALAVLSCLTLAACSNNEDCMIQENEKALPIRFNANVEDLQSRGSHTDHSHIDNFGVAVQTTTGTPVYDYDNVLFTANPSHSKWNPTKAVLWDKTDHRVNILAYAPYRKDIWDLFNKTQMYLSVSDIQTADDYTNDFLICRLTDFNPSTLTAQNPYVNLTFKHTMSQLNVVLHFNDNFSQKEIDETADVTVDGTILDGICNFSKASNFVSANLIYKARTITLYKLNTQSAEHTLTYQCLVIPQTVKKGELTIIFRVGNWYYSWSNSDQELTFVENTSYNLNITVNKDNVTGASLQRCMWTNNGTNTVIKN